MGVFDSELKKLPGVSTEIVSVAQTTYDTSQWQTTDSVVVIGTAFNGPSGVLVPVWGPEHAQYVFGGTYNSKTKREVDLVAGVQEAWDKGCRTIYCLRIGGKDLYKDFDMCLGNGYKLRVSSMYPTNSGKQAYFVYDNTDGAESITFYKVPDRATVNERNNGLVESANEMLEHTIRINQDYGFTKDSPLVDVINLFNGYTYNNVLRFSIIDKDGTDITASPDAYSIPVGALFPGIYFIGRSKNAAKMPIKTNVKTNLVFDNSDASRLPYETFDGSHFVTLLTNTDVSSSYPIYGTAKALREALAQVGISMVEEYDFLKVLNASNKAFPEDDVDYEETGLTNFEKYQRLGKGFAITAHLEKRVDGKGNELTPKVVETKSTDANRIVGIEEGIYSMLQDAPIDYRVMGSLIPADVVVGGKLPKPDDFKVAIPSEVSLIKSSDSSDIDIPYLLTMTAKADSSDITSPVKQYRLKFKSLDIDALPALTADTVYTDEIFELIPLVAAEENIDLTVSNGTKVLVGTKDSAKLYEVVDGKAAEVLAAGYEDGTSHTRYAVTIATDTLGENNVITSTTVEHVIMESAQDTDTTKMVFKSIVVNAAAPGAGREDPSTTPQINLDGKQYIIIDINQQLFVWQLSQRTLTPVADYDSLKSANFKDNDLVFVYAESLPMAVNFVQIASPHFEVITLSDFVTEVNDNDVFNSYFTMEMTAQGTIVKDDYMKGSGEDDSAITGLADSLIDQGIVVFGADRSIEYNYNEYIPYRTTDNFARQLAQHCTYTELKTARTHGIIGVERMIDTSLTTIANKVNHLLNFNFDLYAKKNNGRNLLDANNEPVSIGRNISVVFAGEYVNMDSNSYSFLSNGAAAYAGIISQLEITRSSTMYSITISPVFELTHSQLEALTELGIITVRNSYTKGYVITDGSTMAEASDIMKRLNVVRIAGAVEDGIRAAAEPYIGKQNTLENRNAMETAITSEFKILVSNGLISSYDFTIMDDATADYYTYVDINYDIVPVGEIRNVHNVISVRSNAA